MGPHGARTDDAGRDDAGPRHVLGLRRIRPEVAALRATPRTDVLIIGGGINGVAIFRDLALQGVDVTLIDRGDIAAQTSAASSRMIHGGLRYLEHGELRLVGEAVAERNDLLATAPHAVRPLVTTIPLRTYWTGLLGAPLRLLGLGGGHQPRGAVLVKAGLVLYDRLSRRGTGATGTGVPPHRFAGRARSRRELPALAPDVRATATYVDAGVHAPERLALELALDALAAHPGARLATYVEAVGADRGRVRVRDVLTGARAVLEPRLVINVTGPFADLTNAALGEPSRHLGGSKGSHLVLDHPALLAATHGREIFFENGDGRIVLIHPQRGRVILGTTEIPWDAAQAARCTEEEVDYLLGAVPRVFPGISVTRDDVVFRYAGIRPLPRSEGADRGRVSRDYRLAHGLLPARRSGEPVPLITVVGGKWTTFRALGERVADEALEHLGRERVLGTRGRAIGGGRGFPVDDERDAWVARHLPGVPRERAHALLERYGTRAVKVAAAGGAPLTTLPGYTAGEIAWLVTRERVVHLADLALRRTPLAFEGRLTLDALEELASATGGVLGWTRRRRREEVEAVLAELVDAHGVDLERPARGRLRGARTRIVPAR